MLSSSKSLQIPGGDSSHDYRTSLKLSTALVKLGLTCHTHTTQPMSGLYTSRSVTNSPPDDTPGLRRCVHLCMCARPAAKAMLIFWEEEPQLPGPENDHHHASCIMGCTHHVTFKS